MGGAPYFSHGGWDEGFCAILTAHRDAGYGVAVMINSNHPAFLDEVVRATAMAYGWDGYGLLDRKPLPKIALESYPGRYRYNGEQAFSVVRQGDAIFMRYVGDLPQELIHTGNGIYVRRERGARITFAEEDGAPVFQFILDADGRQSHRRLAEGERTAREILAGGDRDGALAAYRKLQEDGDDAASEGYLNNQGMDLVQRGVHDLGVALLLVNCDLYPASANTWDSVGWAYREAGNREKALEYYRKAVEIDPEFQSAVQALAEMTGG
jgi:tetratricopeptide (TPR) repeat protein